MIEFITGIIVGVWAAKKIQVVKNINLPKLPRMPWHAKIVKFENGKYGIRRWNGGYEYYSMSDGHLRRRWWTIRSCVLEHGQADKETCEKRFQEMEESKRAGDDNGTPVEGH